MTEQSGLTLRGLMGDIPALGPEVNAKLRDDPKKSVTATTLGLVGAEAADSVLDVDVLEALAQAWCTARELQEYADPSKHPGDQKSTVYLGVHEFTKTVYPTLTITIKPFDPLRLRFTLNLGANIRSVALWIAGGRITAIGSGDGAVTAQLEYERVELKKVESQKVQFPSRHDFVPGLRIGLGAGERPPGS